MPTVTTDSLAGGWNLPVGCQLAGSSPNLAITFFTPKASSTQLSTGLSGTAASPWGTGNVSISASTITALNNALATFSPFAPVQAVAAYAFWAAYALFVQAGGT